MGIFKARIAEEEAARKRNWAIGFTIVGGIGVAACSIGTLGIGTPACVAAGIGVGAGLYAAANYEIQRYEFDHLATTGQEINLKSSALQSIGVDRPTADKISAGVDVSAGFAFEASKILSTAWIFPAAGSLMSGTKVAAAASNIATSITASSTASYAVGAGAVVGGGALLYGGANSMASAYEQYGECTAEGASCNSAQWSNIGESTGSGVTQIAGGSVLVGGGASLITGNYKHNLHITDSDKYLSSDPQLGWNVGDSINNYTSKGNVPSWDTVRQRFWKNEALYNASSYTDDQLKLMTKGNAPRIVDNTGSLVSLELHHTPVPIREGGLFRFNRVTPAEHSAIDPFRKL